MKNTPLVLVLLAITGFGFAQNATQFKFTAEIANRNTDTIKILNPTNGVEILKMGIDKNQQFKGSTIVENGFFVLFDGKEYANLYLKNTMDLKLNLDAKDFDASIKFSGVGAAENNYLTKTFNEERKFDYNGMLQLNEVDFAKKLEEKISNMNAALKANNLDADFTSVYQKNMETSFNSLKQYHKELVEKNKANGQVSPIFEYANTKGEKVKLTDFKGKYVYIDVWATWCGPCLQEIPSLKKLEEKFRDKNIVFVSISVDEMKNIEKWKTMVANKSLAGVQLISDDNFNSKFIKDYKINSIPRFILIDPNGNIVKADAPRPSSNDIVTLLESITN